MTSTLPSSRQHLTNVGTTSVSVNIYAGNGPEMLLIHGIGSSGGDFDPVIAELATFSSPIVMDLRGHGASSKPESGYHYSDYVSDIDAVIADLALHRPIVLGHSLGGIVTLMWAARYPETAKALIIEDSPLRSGEEFREAFEGWLQLNALSQAQVRSWNASKNPDWSSEVLDRRSFDMVNTARAAIVELQTASLANEGLDSFAGLENINVPMLFLQGDIASGSMVAPSDLRLLQTRMPQTTIETFPGVGHTIHRSQPEAWVEAVRRFVESLPD